MYTQTTRKIPNQAKPSYLESNLIHPDHLEEMNFKH